MMKLGNDMWINCNMIRYIQIVPPFIRAVLTDGGIVKYRYKSEDELNDIRKMLDEF